MDRRKRRPRRCCKAAPPSSPHARGGEGAARRLRRRQRRPDADSGGGRRPKAPVATTSASTRIRAVDRAGRRIGERRRRFDIRATLLNYLELATAQIDEPRSTSGSAASHGAPGCRTLKGTDPAAQTLGGATAEAPAARPVPLCSTLPGSPCGSPRRRRSTASACFTPRIIRRRSMAARSVNAAQLLDEWTEVIPEHDVHDGGRDVQLNTPRQRAAAVRSSSSRRRPSERQRGDGPTSSAPSTTRSISRRSVRSNPTQLDSTPYAPPAARDGDGRRRCGASPSAPALAVANGVFTRARRRSRNG